MPEADEMFDWVIVGSGGGAMTSALMMSRAGKSVVMLEKSDWVGGTTCKSGGTMWIPNNRFMDPGEDSTEKAITYLNAVVPDGPEFPGTSPERRIAYATEAPRMIDFLHGEGIAMERGSRFWPDYYDELPGGCKTSRTVQALPFDKTELGDWAPRLRQGFLEMPVRLDDAQKIPFARNSWAIKLMIAKVGFRVVLGKILGRRWVTAGAALQGRMLQAVLKTSTDIRTGTPVSDVIVGDDGKVTGVVTVRDGKPWRIGARLGVLVNAGGFGKSQPMRDKYMPGTHAEWSNEIESNTGDMHMAMERAGAVLAQMDEMVGFQSSRAPGWEDAYVIPGMQAVTAKPYSILVDQTGVRYLNEGGSYELYCQSMRERDRVAPAVPSWAIMDSRYMAKYSLADRLGGGAVKPAWRESGWLKEGATIEELAQQIGVDPATLKNTVERWNGFVDAGRDEDFHRGARAYDDYLGDPFFDGPNKTMGKLEQGPFYAAEVIPADVGTYGGVVTDINARVLRADGSPIEGLYACGISTASPFGGVYPGAGASVGPSMTFGWIAAKHAAGLGNQ
ncbi:MAG: FAD-binding protein [Novosphingobium sp.]|nr:FAD-binding protein [Novosphingobium sp.]MCP5404253.1 FAD-binding protein [Novosphingobium sp.]